MHKVLSEISGSVWKVEVQPGQAVQAGQTLLVVESMKMEIPVLAEADGEVLEIRVRPGDVVQEGDLLVVLG